MSSGITNELPLAVTATRHWVTRASAMVAVMLGMVSGVDRVMLIADFEEDEDG
jgi:hypothetical protein